MGRSSRASRVLLASAVVVVCLGAWLPAGAQSPLGPAAGLSVTVVDQTGAVVPGARVALRGSGDRAGRGAVVLLTDGRGQVLFHGRSD